MIHLGSNSFNNVVVCLQARGFEYDFSFNNYQLVCTQSQLLLNCHEVCAVEMHFYPRESHATADRMLYAINVPGYAIKGLLVINGVSDNIVFLKMIERKNKTQAKALVIKAGL